MSFFDYLSCNFHYAIIKKCSENRCTLKIGIFKEFIILKGELLADNEKASDCVFIINLQEKYHIAIAELKKSVRSTENLEEKLKNTTMIIKSIIRNYKGSRLEVKFYHFVISFKWPHNCVFQHLKSTKIRIEGKQHHIIPKKCGFSLSEIIC
ncbi:MAG: hypothetical protein ACTSP3_03315 [Candidatus Heimdallarchaeaceae archaeon]